MPLYAYSSDINDSTKSCISALDTDPPYNCNGNGDNSSFLEDISKIQPEQSPKPGQIIRRNSKDFIFHKIIGEGSFSTVYMGQDVHTLNNYAIKVMDKRHILRLRKQACVKREKEVLQTLNANPHPFFVKLYCTFQDAERLFIVLSYAKNGEILNYINRTNGFDLATSRFYTAELVVALEHLHRMNVIHRDLKPENILLDWDMHIKITDFGSATFYNNRLSPAHPSTATTSSPSINGPCSNTPPSVPSSTIPEKPSAQTKDSVNFPSQAAAVGSDLTDISSANTFPIAANPSPNNSSALPLKATTTPAPNARGSSFVGTAQYVSPEVLTSKQISYGSDLWALGCVLYQFLTGQYPFKANNEYHIFQKIINLNYAFPANMDPDAQDLIQNLIKIEPASRLGSLETGGYAALKAHPFFDDLSVKPLDKIHTLVPPLALIYPSEVRVAQTPTPDSLQRRSSDSMALVEYKKSNILPGLDDGQLNRLHGLGMMNESFSELSIHGSYSQIPPEMVENSSSATNCLPTHTQYPLYVINAESSSSKNSSNTAVSSTEVNPIIPFETSDESSSKNKQKSSKNSKYSKSSTLPTSAVIEAVRHPRRKSSEELLENSTIYNGGQKAVDKGVRPTLAGKKSFLGMGSRRKGKKKSSLLLPFSSNSSRSGTPGSEGTNRKHPLSTPAHIWKKKHHTSDSTRNHKVQEESSASTGITTDESTITTASQSYEQFTGGRKIIKQGLVDKKVGLFSRRRMLLLTEGPHLYYVDPINMVLKGEIPWSQNLKTEAKTFKIFHIHTPKRTYYLEDPEGYALKWCQAISQIHKQTYGDNCECNETAEGVDHRDGRCCQGPETDSPEQKAHHDAVDGRFVQGELSFPSLNTLKKGGTTKALHYDTHTSSF